MSYHRRTFRTGGRHHGAPARARRLPLGPEQTFDSIKPYTLEETYEVLEAIDNRDWPELAGELGDLLLQVLFYAEMAKEQKSFSIDDVLDRLSTKLINRHPHVFGDVKADTADQVKRNWEAIKVRRGRSGKRQARRRAQVAGQAFDPGWRSSADALAARSLTSSVPVRRRQDSTGRMSKACSTS